MSPVATVETEETQQQGVVEELPFRFEILPIEDMYIDRFQRPVNPSWLKARKGRYDPALLGTVVLSERVKGKKNYSVIDGQHRVELTRQEELTQVPCVVFYGLTLQQEADLFIRLQQQRRTVSSHERFTAEIVAGRERAKAIDKIVRECGYVLDPDRETENRIRAIVTLEKIYDEEPSNLRKILTLVRDTWGEAPYARNQQMLKGVWYFVRDTEDLDMDRFVERLKGVLPSVLAMRATQLREGSGVSTAGIPKFLREAIENEYRSRRRPASR